MPSCQAAAAGSPPLAARAGLRRAHVFPCLSRGRRLRERSGCSEDPRGPGEPSLGLPLFVPNPEPGTRPALRNPWCAGTPGTHGPCSRCGKQRDTHAQLGTRLREGGDTLCAPSTQLG